MRSDASDRPRGATHLTVLVIDANTVVSAALNPGGIPRRAVALARARGSIALSAAVHAEIAEVLARPKFARVLTADRPRDPRIAGRCRDLGRTAGAGDGMPRRQG